MKGLAQGSFLVSKMKFYFERAAKRKPPKKTLLNMLKALVSEQPTSTPRKFLGQSNVVHTTVLRKLKFISIGCCFHKIHNGVLLALNYCCHDTFTRHFLGWFVTGNEK